MYTYRAADSIRIVLSQYYKINNNNTDKKKIKCENIILRLAARNTT